MNALLETITETKLLYEDTIIGDEDLIKVTLTNGEVLIGYYIKSSDKDLDIRRECGDEEIDFSDIEKIEVE